MIRPQFSKINKKSSLNDNYDIQPLLDNLEELVYVNPESQDLFKQMAWAIQNALEIRLVYFVHAASSGRVYRSFGVRDNFVLPKSMDSVFKYLDHHGLKLLNYADIEQNSPHLAKTLDHEDLRIVARLYSADHMSNDAKAYLCLGKKPAGGYSAAQLKTISLLASFLTLATANSFKNEEIQSLNSTLDERVKRVAYSLKRSNQKLEALDAAKDDFISLASHQLRTPLTSVKGYLSMVIEGDTGKISARQQKLLNQAFMSSQRMVYIIADLLNISRLRTGNLVLELSPVNLAELIEQEVSQLQAAAGLRGIKLIYKKPKDFPELMLDETKIRQVIMNFLDNALFYTPAKGKIIVTLENTARNVQFQVEDSGIGVPEAMQPRLFSKYYRAPNARKVRPDGMGLGLYMAKKIVIAHLGALIFRSQEAKGSTFGFTLNKSKLKVLDTSTKPTK